MQPMRISRYLLWLALAVGLVLLDLLTKHLAGSNLELYRPVEVFSWLNLSLAHNQGAAFSFLAGAGGWQRWFFSAVAVIIGVVLLVWLKRLPGNARLLPTALTLVLAGAVGNLVDRLVHGHVIDFVDAHWAGYHWPAFNLADSVIVIGVILLIIESFLPRHR